MIVLLFMNYTWSNNYSYDTFDLFSFAILANSYFNEIKHSFVLQQDFTK